MAGPGFGTPPSTKRHSGVPVIANGKVDDPDTALSTLADESADIVALGKGALANRNWPHLVRNNLGFEELDPSIFAPFADVKDLELQDPM